MLIILDLIDLRNDQVPITAVSIKDLYWDFLRN